MRDYSKIISSPPPYPVKKPPEMMWRAHKMAQWRPVRINMKFSEKNPAWRFRCKLLMMRNKRKWKPSWYWNLTSKDVVNDRKEIYCAPTIHG